MSYFSATADSEKFAEYLGGTCIDVPGRTFPVTPYFLRDAIKDVGFVVEDGSEFALKRRKMQSQQFNISGSGGKSTTQTVEYELKPDPMIERMDLDQVNLDLVEDLCRYINNNAAADPSGSKEDKGSILVFLPGFSEIKRLFDRLSMDAKRQKVKVIPLHSMLGTGSQQVINRLLTAGCFQTSPERNAEDCSCYEYC
jgi:HrpA-like RNA helicase